MNIIKHLKSTVIIAILLSFSQGVLAAETAYESRIEKQTKAVEAAKKAKEINAGELKSLKKEIEAIKVLYARYWSDKKISAREAKTLDSKLKDSDVNLFRKKYN